MNRTNRNVVKNRKLALRRRGNKCRRCGSRFSLEMAHRSPTEVVGKGRGRAARVRDWLENPRRYVLLCRWCHREFDKLETSSERRAYLASGNLESRISPDGAVPF